MLPMTCDELSPALSSWPAMSATSLKEKPSCCSAGPLDWTTDTRSLKPMPVDCDTPKR